MFCHKNKHISSLYVLDLPSIMAGWWFIRHFIPSEYLTYQTGRSPCCHRQPFFKAMLNNDHLVFSQFAENDPLVISGYYRWNPNAHLQRTLEVHHLSIIQSHASQLTSPVRISAHPNVRHCWFGKYPRLLWHWILFFLIFINFLLGWTVEPSKSARESCATNFRPCELRIFFFPPRQGLESLQHSGRAQGFAILQRKSLESCCFGAHGYILGIPSANVLVSPGVPWHRRWKVIQATSTSSPLSQGKTLLLLVVYQVTYSQVPPSSISNLYAEA